MLKAVFNVKPVSATEVDMLLYGVIGDSWFEEGNPADKFVAQFKALEPKYQRINIKINGPGGSVWDGLPIFNVIKSSANDTHTYNDGIAFSMSAMILLAGKTVHAAKGSMMMLHNVSGVAYGNAKDLRTAANELDVHDEVLSEMIADKTGLTVDEVKSRFMNYDDNFMTATRALANNLVDVVEDYAADIPTDVASMSPKDIVAHYTQHPTFQRDKQHSDMSKPIFRAVAALSGVAPSALTQEQIDAANTEIAEAGIEGVALVLESDLENNATQIENLTGQVTAHTETIAQRDATITAHEATIAELQEKLKAPATDAATPPAGGDVIPATDTKPAYQKTSVDLEKERLRAQWS